MDIHCHALRDRRVAASDARSLPPRRAAIRAIILHQTSGAGRTFLPGTRERYPADAVLDADVRSDHRIDHIAAHFVVVNDGTVFYTHDVERLSRSAGLGVGIDIEFAGLYTGAHRLTPAAIRAGRALVTALCTQIATITHIHPHGQVQSQLMDGTACGGDTGVRCGKLDSCPGPDIWVNVGMYCAARHGLTTDPPLSPPYQNNGITRRQTDPAFDQHIL